MATTDAALHEDQWATVTPTKVVLNGTVYAPANIASVAVRPMRGNAFFPSVGLLVMAFGLQFATCGAACIDPVEGGHRGLFAGIVCFVGGIAFIKWGPLLTKTRHTIFLGTGGQEVAAIYSYDPAWASRVAAAIVSVIGVRAAG